MSWAGFKKSVGRAGTQIMMKTGQVDKTVDSQFAEQETSYKTLEKSTLSLQKEAKTYLDSIRAMTGAQARIAETVDNFYSDNSDIAMAGHSYRRAVDELDTVTARDLETPFRATVLEPVGKLCSHHPEINACITKRAHKLLDYDSARTRARKLMEKPSDDPSKLPRAQQEEEAARDVYESINEQIMHDLPIFMDLRVPYLDPSFEAMVRMQCKFAEEGYNILAGTQRYFAETVRDDYANGQLDAQVEAALSELQQLSICGLAG